MDNNEYLSQMSLGFRDSGQTDVVIITILMIIIVFIVVFFLVRNIVRRSRAVSLIRHGNLDRRADTMFRARDMNTAQVKVVYDLINDFKKREILAEAVPVSVLEHFAEYFYRNFDRLNISKNIAERLTPALFPLTENTTVEIELVRNNKLFVFEKKVVKIADRKILVQKIDNLAELTGQGQKLVISYISNKIYIRGDSRIINMNDGRGLLTLSYPRNLVISKERRFSRVPLQPPVVGYLSQARHPELGKIPVKIRDISLEGLRVETRSVLKKNMIYQAAFEDGHFGTPYVFENFECTVTKSMISDDHLFEYGLAFVYIDLMNRDKLAKYINEWVDPMKLGLEPRP